MSIGAKAKIAGLGLAEYVIEKILIVRFIILMLLYALTPWFITGIFFWLIDKWQGKPSKPFTAFRFEVKERLKQLSDANYKREQSD